MMMRTKEPKNATYLQAEEGAKTTGETRADNGAHHAVAKPKREEGVAEATPPVRDTTTETRKTMDRTGKEVVVGAVAAVAEVGEDMLAAAMIHLKSRSIPPTKKNVGTKAL
jgi:hypothetical protein